MTKMLNSSIRRSVHRLALIVVTLLTVVVIGAPHAEAKSAPESFADLADRLLPAVVNISTSQVIEGRSGAQEMPQFPPGSPFEEFFKDFLDKQAPDQKKKTRKQTSLGSGFVIDYLKNGDAYVVTNNHVIQDADEVYVILADDTRLKADIVGRDNKTDLAVLKVHADRKLASVGWGNSDKARVGDWVVAIGNPFGLGGTVTAGIISARGRDIQAGPYDNFIQTDASINRGNSGGPMFNMAGEVIGINTAIYSPSGGSVGIGFAIPTSSARPVVEQLIKHGQVRRGWLGVHIQVVTPAIAETLGMKKTEGALVASVIDGGPAQNAGIRARDVIVEFDGKRVTEMRKLPRIVASTDVGRLVDVKVWRDGAMTTLKVDIAKMEDDELVAEAPQNGTPKDKPTAELKLGELGFTIAPLTSATRTRFDLSDDSQGVVVVDVDPAGPAFDEGVRPGDVVAEVSQEKVASLQDVQRLVRAAKDADKRSVLLLIEGQRGFRFVAISLL
ncbi:DegQ family serine endoprotease [Pseudomonadota bacterium]